MGWKTVKGNRYFYERVRRKGRSTEICWGYGREAREAAARVERKKQAKVDDEDCLLRWAIEDKKLERETEQLSRRVRQEVGRHLRRAGYRLHNLKWRKMQERTLHTDEPAELASPALVSAEKFSFMEGTIRTIALDGLRRTGPDHKLEDFDQKAISADMADKEAILRKELQFESSSGIERLLIEQIITAFVQWYIASWQVETMPYGDEYLKKNHYLERRYARCQLRLSRTVDQLARVRCVPREYLMGGKPLAGEAVQKA